MQRQRNGTRWNTHDHADLKVRDGDHRERLCDVHEVYVEVLEAIERAQAHKRHWRRRSMARVGSREDRTRAHKDMHARGTYRAIGKDRRQIAREEERCGAPQRTCSSALQGASPSVPGGFIKDALKEY